MAFYIATIIVYGAVDSMACLALNAEFGFAGLSNFGFIIFQAVGAYVAAILSMGGWKTSNAGFQQYVLGWHLPFPLPWIGACWLYRLSFSWASACEETSRRSACSSRRCCSTN
jgi:ABC-type branched-subunit amino acid transport system permease subunit